MRQQAHLGVVVVPEGQPVQGVWDWQSGGQHVPPDGHAPLCVLQHHLQPVGQDIAGGHQLLHLCVAEMSGPSLSGSWQWMNHNN